MRDEVGEGFSIGVPQEIANALDQLIVSESIDEIGVIGRALLSYRPDRIVRERRFSTNTDGIVSIYVPWQEVIHPSEELEQDFVRFRIDLSNPDVKDHIQKYTKRAGVSYAEFAKGALYNALLLKNVIE